MKDPRMVSTSHHADKHITWTLPGLHGAIEYYLFDMHAKRIHQRFGMSPNDYEKRLILECGARDHVIVRFDETFKLLTSPHSGRADRKIDRQRGVFVDGFWYWHDKLALATPGELAVVRVELWRARIVYVLFRDNWYIAQARDGGVLEGRYRHEFELQQREETRARRTAAQKDKVSAANSKKRTLLWDNVVWDPRQREELSEMYALYERLGMTEVFEEAKNPLGGALTLGMPKGTELDLIYAVQGEPGVYVGDDQLAEAVSKSTASTLTEDDSTAPRGKRAKRTATQPTNAPTSTTSASAPAAATDPSDKPFEQEAAATGAADDDYF
jgi:putative transposase